MAKVDALEHGSAPHNLMIDHPNGYASFYGHLLEQPDLVVGQPVQAGQVVAKVGDQVKTIRFGQQGVRGAGKNPKSAKQKARKKSFMARHGKNIAKGKLSAAYWAAKTKW